MKKYFTLILLALLPIVANAYDAEIDGIYYNFSGNEATVTYRDNNYNSYSGAIVIPQSITYEGKTYSVTSIGGYAFRGCEGLTSIIIPNSVTSIGGWAFYGCSGLTKVIVPDIAAWCGIPFYSDNPLRYAHHIYSDEETEITDLVIPDGVTSISNSAFYGCSGLTSVTIPNSVTSIGERTFYECSGLTSVTIGNGVISIGDDAFRRCSSLTSITIPNSVTSIGHDAFRDCSSLISVTFGNNLAFIGSQVIPLSTMIYTPISESLFTLWKSGYNNIREIGTDRSLGRPYLLVTKKSVTSMTISVKNAHLGFRFSNSLNISGNMVTLIEENPTIILKGLDPETQYEISLTVAYTSYKTFSYVLNKSVKTEALILTPLQPKVISDGNVILAAQTNIDDEETNAGFEWRRTDWTDDFDSKSGTAILYEGMMEGYIRSINSNFLWKFRPYYTSNAGNTYYGEWKGLDPSDYSYFEPTVRTYATVNVNGNSAEVKGYAMRGTDKITSQGFMYWSTGTASSRRMANGVPSDAKTVLANGNVMTATLENLEYNTQYCCVAFVTTEENETFYGEVQTFTTDVAPNVIGDLNKDSKVDIADAVTVLNIMASGEYNGAADINGDNKIDIADFVTILNIMAGQGGEESSSIVGTWVYKPKSSEYEHILKLIFSGSATSGTLKTQEYDGIWDEWDEEICTYSYTGGMSGTLKLIYNGEDYDEEKVVIIRVVSLTAQKLVLEDIPEDGNCTFYRE